MCSAKSQLCSWRGSSQPSENGFAIAEFAITLPVLVLLTYLLAWAASVVQCHLQLLGLAQTTVRIIARGDVIPQSLKQDIEARAVMTVTQNGEILRVHLRATKSVPFGLPLKSVDISESATALVELTPNDFEQD